LQHNHAKLQRIKKEWSIKQGQLAEIAGTQATSLAGESISEATSQAL
jgi:hypothetical protein